MVSPKGEHSLPLKCHKILAKVKSTRSSGKLALTGKPTYFSKMLIFLSLVLLEYKHSKIVGVSNVANCHSTGMSYKKTVLIKQTSFFSKNFYGSLRV